MPDVHWLECCKIRKKIWFLNANSNGMLMIGSRRRTKAQSHFLFYSERPVAPQNMFTKVAGWNLSLGNGMTLQDPHRHHQTFLIGCDWSWQSDNQVIKHSTLATVLLKCLRPLTFLQSPKTTNHPFYHTNIITDYHDVIQTDSARLVNTQKPQIRLPQAPPGLVTIISEI